MEKLNGEILFTVVALAGAVWVIEVSGAVLVVINSVVALACKPLAFVC